MVKYFFSQIISVVLKLLEQMVGQPLFKNGEISLLMNMNMQNKKVEQIFLFS